MSQGGGLSDAAGDAAALEIRLALQVDENKNLKTTLRTLNQRKGFKFSIDIGRI